MLSGSSLSCTILDELLNYSGVALSQLLSGNDRRPYLSREWVKCIKPVPNRQWLLSLGQELLGLFGAFSECPDVWCNLGKGALWFMSGSSLTRLNVRRTGVRPVSPARDNFVCLAFPTVRWRARTRWPRSAAVCTRWTPLTRARPPRTPLGLSWPPWDSSRTLTSCARSSASSWRQSAPTWRYVFSGSPPAFFLPSLWRRYAGCLYTDVGWWQNQIMVMQSVSSLLWNLALILDVTVSFCVLGRHAYSYSNSLMEIADRSIDSERRRWWILSEPF